MHMHMHMHLHMHMHSVVTAPITHGSGRHYTVYKVRPWSLNARLQPR